jgi:tetratricopeptide (TPR) repeat protein
MVNIRPDLRSYSRISYIREIYGDYPGAIEAMQLAVRAGAPGEEGTAWTKVQLGKLYEDIGDTAHADMYYTMTEDERPNYAYGLAGLARLAIYRKDYPAAINYYSKADTLINDFNIKQSLADAYSLAGQKDKSAELMKEVIDSMNSQAQSGNNNANIGHYVDKELAYAYVKTGDYDKALEHALLEYNRRPDNIDVNEAVAWVYYCKGDYAKALPYIKTALKTGSKNPTLLCYAGLIYAKNGDKPQAKADFAEALKTNPIMDESLKQNSLAAMHSL